MNKRNRKRRARFDTRKYNKAKFIPVSAARNGLFGPEIQASPCLHSLTRHMDVTYENDRGQERTKTISHALQCVRDDEHKVHRDVLERTWS